MNKGEAMAVMEVLDWLTSLTLFELHPDCGVDDATLLDAVDVLATRAGTSPGIVRRNMAAVLDRPDLRLPARQDDDEDVPPNAGSAT